MEEFSKSGFEAVQCDPFQILLVAGIKTLHVRPQHHHQGIGKGVLQAGLAALEVAGHTSPWLMVNAQNQEAMGFYTAQGFERVGKRNFCIGDAQFLNYILSCTG